VQGQRVDDAEQGDHDHEAEQAVVQPQGRVDPPRKHRVLLVAAKDLDAGVRRVVGERPLDRCARSAFRHAGTGHQVDLAQVGVVGGREALVVGRGDEVPADRYVELFGRDVPELRPLVDGADGQRPVAARPVYRDRRADREPGAVGHLAADRDRAGRQLGERPGVHVQGQHASESGGVDGGHAGAGTGDLDAPAAERGHGG